MKLQQNKHGVYYMITSVPRWCTWHATSEGAALLERKRIRVGDEIPRKVFDELRRKNYLYTDGSGPGEENVGFGSSRSFRSGGRKSKKADELDTRGCLTLVGLFLVILFLIKVYEFFDGLF